MKFGARDWIRRAVPSVGKGRTPVREHIRIGYPKIVALFVTDTAIAWPPGAITGS